MYVYSFNNVLLSYVFMVYMYLTFTRRIKSHLLFAGIIRRSPFPPRFQDKG